VGLAWHIRKQRSEIAGLSAWRQVRIRRHGA
jgi:hypothetical protein